MMFLLMTLLNINTRVFSENSCDSYDHVVYYYVYLILFQGRFGQLTDPAPIFLGTAASYFTFRRNSINPAFVELVLTRNLNDDTAQEYQV